MKKVIKLAVIRGGQEKKCPFGLDIPFGCKSAGDLVEKMAPISILGKDADNEEINELASANNMLLQIEGSNVKCIYADKVFSDKHVVECNWGTNTQGMQSSSLLGSPFYSRVYQNIAYDGLYSYPMGFYGDSNISRNLFYGIYSLQGSEKKDNIKTASLSSDILDAVNHYAETYGSDDEFCYIQNETVNMSLFELSQYDDFSSWVEFDFGQLQDLTNEEIAIELEDFRKGWSDMAMSWLKNGNIPPVIVIEALDGVTCIGDGRGRTNLAIGLGLTSLPVILLKETQPTNATNCIKPNVL